MELMIVGVGAFAAGFIQALTGFGAGIILMLMLPMIFTMPVASGINNCITIFLNISLVVYFFKDINFKKIILPSVIAMIFSTIAIRLASILPVATLKLIFSIFIIILAVYFNSVIMSRSKIQH